MFINLLEFLSFIGAFASLGLVFAFFAEIPKIVDEFAEWKKIIDSRYD